MVTAKSAVPAISSRAGILSSSPRIARSWHRYEPEPLRAFADRAYRVFEEALPLLTEENAARLHGYVVNDMLVRYATADGIAEALSRVGTISPQRCRDVATERFHPRSMADRYEALYQDVLAQL